MQNYLANVIDINHARQCEAAIGEPHLSAGAVEPAFSSQRGCCSSLADLLWAGGGSREHTLSEVQMRSPLVNKEWRDDVDNRHD